MTTPEASKPRDLLAADHSIPRLTTKSVRQYNSQASVDISKCPIVKRKRINRLCFRRVNPNLRTLTLVASLSLASSYVHAQQTRQTEQTETIVLIRHGEKPLGGLGQLACRGLNRALALPHVLVSKYGKPDYLFAPNPSVEIRDGNSPPYSYVRPLLTIAPTAVRLAMPINTQIGYNQIRDLQDTLSQPLYGNSMVFVAWEHVFQVRFAKILLDAYGLDPTLIPQWKDTDYDSIWIFRIKQTDGKKTLSFTVDAEGLNDTLGDTCPGS